MGTCETIECCCSMGSVSSCTWQRRTARPFLDDCEILRLFCRPNSATHESSKVLLHEARDGLSGIYSRMLWKSIVSCSLLLGICKTTSSCLSLEFAVFLVSGHFNSDAYSHISCCLFSPFTKHTQSLSIVQMGRQGHSPLGRGRQDCRSTPRQ